MRRLQAQRRLMRWRLCWAYGFAGLAGYLLGLALSALSYGPGMEKW